MLRRIGEVLKGLFYGTVALLVLCVTSVVGLVVSAVLSIIKLGMLGGAALVIGWVLVKEAMDSKARHDKSAE